MLVEHVPPERWARELARVTDRRDPPVAVSVWLLLDGRAWEGRLHGWAVDPLGAGGLMGLVFLVREFTPGFEAEYLHWEPVRSISRHGDRPPVGS